MPLYRYVKSVVVDSPARTVSFTISKQIFWKLIPNVFILIGTTALTAVVYPLVSYQLTANRWQQQTFLSPVSETQIAEAKGLLNPLVLGSNSQEEWAATKLEPEIITGVDFTKVDNWFPEAPQQRVKQSKITHYRLSIPKLKINQAVVEVGGTDLDRNLVQYGGTALPGEYGNTVIFGHSVLPVFYNPRDYHTIFSTIPTLEKGDEIYIDSDGVQYKYVVDSYSEVKPEEVEVLEQRFDRQSLTLVTCVPPGTYLRRGTIQAYLTEL